MFVVSDPSRLLPVSRSSVTHRGNISANEGASLGGWRLVWMPNPPARQNHRWDRQQRELDSALCYRWDSPSNEKTWIIYSKKRYPILPVVWIRSITAILFMYDLRDNAIILIPQSPSQKRLQSNMQWTMNEYMHLLACCAHAPVRESALSLSATPWGHFLTLRLSVVQITHCADIRFSFQLVSSFESILQAWLDSTVPFIKVK